MEKHSPVSLLDFPPLFALLSLGFVPWFYIVIPVTHFNFHGLSFLFLSLFDELASV